ncbi:MAG: sodium:solute symporter [Prevotella sp.]
MIILLTIIIYFVVLMLISRITGRSSDNDAFFRGNRRSPWYMVAFGMVGASISGVTFVSVPGMILSSDMTYLQTCMGFILGYFAVALILLPVYYKHNLTTIYTYLDRRLGRHAYTTGSVFFLISKMSGAAARFFVVCVILQEFLLDDAGVPFAVTVATMTALIWLYTRKGGIKTLVWTDTFQTVCMFSALILIIYKVMVSLDMNVAEAISSIAADEHSRIFVFDDWISKQNFWKQFISGIFIVIVMTGLDQDMMQKNLTCKTLRESQKDVCTYGFAFVPVNLLFLSLGVLLTMHASRQGTALPASGDQLLSMFAANGSMGTMVTVLFAIGIVAASFSSADSALTAMTTSYCVDIRRRPADERLRRRAHLGITMVFALFIILFRVVNNTSVIDAIYVMCSYTYGPLLGLFAFGLLTHRQVNDRLVPYIAVASPLICFATDTIVQASTGYRFGYELLMLNGGITFAGLWMSGLNPKKA